MARFILMGKNGVLDVYVPRTGSIDCNFLSGSFSAIYRVSCLVSIVRQPVFGPRVIRCFSSPASFRSVHPSIPMLLFKKKRWSSHGNEIRRSIFYSLSKPLQEGPSFVEFDFSLLKDWTLIQSQLVTKQMLFFARRIRVR